MQPQPFPLYAAGVTGSRKGKVFLVVGWVPHHDEAPNLGLVPVLVPLDGGAVAAKYDVERGIARLYVDMAEAREAARQAR